MELVISESFEIAGRGAAVFFEKDPDPGLPWCKHRVRIHRRGGETLETIGQVEFARKLPPGEVMAILFPELSVEELPIGTTITIVEAINS